MGATVNCTAYILGMVFGTPGGGIHGPCTSVPIAVRAIQSPPNVRSRAGFPERPAMLHRVFDGGSDVLVGMVGHGLSSGSARRLTTWRIIANPHDRRRTWSRGKLVRRIVKALGDSADVTALAAEINAREPAKVGRELKMVTALRKSLPMRCFSQNAPLGQLAAFRHVMSCAAVSLWPRAAPRTAMPPAEWRHPSSKCQPMSSIRCTEGDSLHAMNIHCTVVWQRCKQ